MGRAQGSKGTKRDQKTPDKGQGHRAKRLKGRHSQNVSESRKNKDYISSLSLEILCHIMKDLPLRDIMKLDMMNKQLQQAVTSHLRLRTRLHFQEDELCGWLPWAFTDGILTRLLKRCPEVEYIYGLDPLGLTHKRQPKSDQLTVPGIIEALTSLTKLKGVETKIVKVLEALITHLPDVEILNMFKNMDGQFPIPQSNKITLISNMNVTNLHLSGVIVPDLPQMENVKHLHLRWVRFTNPDPFEDFLAPLLQTFCMNNCAGPKSPLKYARLIAVLGSSPVLHRLELVRVPFVGGHIQQLVEETWRLGGFRELKQITFGACRHVTESDVGFLAITACQRLTELSLQPSLCKDSFFISLEQSRARYPQFDTLVMGWKDSFPDTGQHTMKDLADQGLDDYAEKACDITDRGMMAIYEVFHTIKSLSLINCPFLRFPSLWIPIIGGWWFTLRELNICSCQTLDLSDFSSTVSMLSALESLYLEDLFHELPRGCARVGISSGTGLGIFAAFVARPHSSSQTNQPAAAQNNNQGQGQQQPGNHGDTDGDNHEQDEETGRSDNEQNERETRASSSHKRAGKAGPTPSTSGRGGKRSKKSSQSSNSDFCAKCSKQSRTTCSNKSKSKRKGHTKSSRKGKQPLCVCKCKSINKSGQKRDQPTLVGKVDKACQASSDELREAPAKPSRGHQRSRSRKRRKKSKHRSKSTRCSTVEESEITFVPAQPAKRSKVKKPEMHDQATSTSDPVITENPSKILVIDSHSLINLSIRNCGITDLVIDLCGNLESLTVHGCRSLSSFMVECAPKLTYSSFSQCRCIREDEVVHELLKGDFTQKTERSRFISLRPMPGYDPVQLEYQLLSCESYNYHVALLHDHCRLPKAMLKQRTAFRDCITSLQTMYSACLDKLDFVEAEQKNQWTHKYPYGRRLIRVQGSNRQIAGMPHEAYADTSCVPWDLITDLPMVPWAASYMVCTGRETMEDAMELITQDMCEAMEEKRPIYRHIAFVFVSTCDMDGPVVDDIYI